jgi:hypothetical protein
MESSICLLKVVLIRLKKDLTCLAKGFEVGSHCSFNFALVKTTDSDLVHASTIKGVKTLQVAFQPQTLGFYKVFFSRLKVVLTSFQQPADKICAAWR